MKKATRLFLKQRPDAKHVYVEVVKFDGALANHCYQNAQKLVETNEAELMLICGWIIGDYHGERGTPIIPHYWVFNEQMNRYYDPTPKPEKNIQEYDYVIDLDILRYGSTNANLPLALKLLNNGKWQARNLLGTGYIDLDKVDVEQLYKLRNS